MSPGGGIPAPAAISVGDRAVLDLELGWLNRRRDLLVRAIAEMEQHQRTPYLSQTLMPDVPAMLAWAREELVRVDRCIVERTGRAARQRFLAPHHG